jgi:hypothetical protein
MIIMMMMTEYVLRLDRYITETVLRNSVCDQIFCTESTAPKPFIVTLLSEEHIPICVGLGSCGSFVQCMYGGKNVPQQFLFYHPVTLVY